MPVGISWRPSAASYLNGLFNKCLKSILPIIFIQNNNILYETINGDNFSYGKMILFENSKYTLKFSFRGNPKLKTECL